MVSRICLTLRKSAFDWVKKSALAGVCANHILSSTFVKRFSRVVSYRPSAVGAHCWCASFKHSKFDFLSLFTLLKIAFEAKQKYYAWRHRIKPLLGYFFLSDRKENDFTLCMLLKQYPVPWQWRVCNWQLTNDTAYILCHLSRFHYKHFWGWLEVYAYWTSVYLCMSVCLSACRASDNECLSMC